MYNVHDVSGVDYRSYFSWNANNLEVSKDNPVSNGFAI